MSADDVYLDARADSLIECLRHPRETRRFYLAPSKPPYSTWRRTRPGGVRAADGLICSAPRWNAAWNAVHMASPRICVIGGFRKEESSCGRTLSACEPAE